MEPFRRHLAGLDHTEWAGLMILIVGCVGGSVAIAARYLVPKWPLDIPAMGAYAAIFIIVGVSLYIRGER